MASTPEAIQAQLEKLKKKPRTSKITTFSHMVMGGIMMMFFVGVALGVYVTVFREEPVSTTMDYIMKLAYVVSLGYFIKAFGENIAKIVLPFIFGPRIMGKSEPNNNDQ